MSFDHALYMATSAKTWCFSGTDALVKSQKNFCIEPRLEFCWEIIAGLSAAPLKQGDTRPSQLYFNWTKVLRGVRAIGLLGF